ncbi:MAG TPA: AmmeMemoRadiSam system radical SAM enzyme [Thermoleophilia bacterium]|nr:AmmeMemoRadiSam system radical SAM enzyme [Thermoleophilia bacterium]HQG02714.1 AmmeMemoRadiSam system radical SAM enzyme [Thermoleophilia bacterium]HQG54257.1 AmmeMemoRadiSam system radical SAM enzyme [Thermoleophilia bacterium]HQJ97113.1 AmmeMemoRadiSam system radical SAM enzyme [Thermoleophilia bacterium]
MTSLELHEAMLYERREHGAVQCHVCPRRCVITEGKSGVCRARLNRGGALYTLIYGRVCSVAADPIEKKPLFHFFPGSTVLSLGTVGCNFMCRHCQNWQIAHADATLAARDLRALPVRNLPVLAEHNGCQGVAWTYNEPTIWLEYILDGAQVAHEHGLYTVMVTNGYITDEALEVLAPHIDAYRVDVKGFSPEAYYELCRIRDFQPVLRAAVRAKREFDCHVEIVTNVIPTVNDDETTLRAIARWIGQELGPETPWHVTRFMPYLELSHLPPTPIQTLERALEIGAEEGLSFVYIGNVPGHAGENTVCPSCKRLLVRRTGYEIEDVALRGTFCAMCGENVNIRTRIK